MYIYCKIRCISLGEQKEDIGIVFLDDKNNQSFRILIEKICDSYFQIRCFAFLKSYITLAAL